MGQKTLKRREFVKRILAGTAGAALAGLPALAARRRNKAPSKVLLIIADDLRPQLGCYGERQMVTPNIDRLASRGMLFESSYCQQSICAPSRASLLTGLRPDSTKIYGLGIPVSQALPRHVTLPECFKINGYETISLGKVFHYRTDSRNSWSREPFQPYVPAYVAPDSLALLSTNIEVKPEDLWRQGPATEAPDVPDNSYWDGQLTEYAIREMERLKGKRFLLCVGYAKPHLPYAAPKKYWNLYDPAKLNLAPNPFAPKGVTRYSMNEVGSLASFQGMPKGKEPISDKQARQLIHGYYACVSFLDAQVGRLLAALDAFGLRDETIVVLWGDNGFKLGEHGAWDKHTDFEIDTRVPLIVSIPGLKAVGKRTKALVEAVDVYPTLGEACGLDLPGQPFEGISFAPLLDEPDRPWKKAAFSQYPRRRIMGYALRTERYRYIEWKSMRNGKLLERELYDHDPDPQENANVIAEPAYAEAIKELEQMMNRGWRGALPEPRTTPS